MVRPGFEPETSRPADRRPANLADQAVVSVIEPSCKIVKMERRRDKRLVEGAAYCLKKNLCGKTLIKQDQFTQNQKKNKDL